MSKMVARRVSSQELCGKVEDIHHADIPYMFKNVIHAKSEVVKMWFARRLVPDYASNETVRIGLARGACSSSRVETGPVSCSRGEFGGGFETESLYDIGFQEFLLLILLFFLMLA